MALCSRSAGVGGFSRTSDTQDSKLLYCIRSILNLNMAIMFLVYKQRFGENKGAAHHHADRENWLADRAVTLTDKIRIILKRYMLYRISSFAQAHWRSISPISLQ